MKILILSLILLISSCSGLERSNNSNYEGVKVDISEEFQKVSINQESSNYDSTYGPNISQKKIINHTFSQRKPIIALHLAPAAYHASAYISLFRELEKKEIKIKVISSEGFSSVVAALYAKYGNASLTEFKLYDLYSKLSKKDYLSQDWNEILRNFLDKEFKLTKMNQLNLVMVVPFVDNSEIKMLNEQNVSTVIMNTLDFLSQKSESSMLSNQVIFEDSLRKCCSPDLIYHVSVLPENLSFDKNNQSLIEIYSQKSLQITRNVKSYFLLDYLNLSLDRVNKISEIEKNITRSSEKIATFIKAKVDEWKENYN